MTFKKNIFVVTVLFIFILSLNNVFANYNIDDLDSQITILDNGFHEFKNTFTIANDQIVDNTIILNFINIDPEYIFIKINNSELNDFNLDYNILYLNLANINLEDTYNIEITYYTDYFTFKNSNWYLEYIPLFSTKANSLLIIVSEDYKAINISQSLSSSYIESNELHFLFNNISYLKFNYNLKNNINNNHKNNNVLEFIILLVVLLILYGGYFIFKNNKKRKKKKIINSSDNKIKDLLLGLNENEQKIIKLLLNEDGLSQKKISLKTFLPKGTVSRNIKKLESKDYILIKPYGATHKIFLRDIFKK